MTAARLIGYALLLAAGCCAIAWALPPTARPFFVVVATATAATLSVRVICSQPRTLPKAERVTKKAVVRPPVVVAHGNRPRESRGAAMSRS